ncbi:hypothetical protein NW765_002435 [Fusarium oxysporum]|nr:hypothetical protein NW765_002435 [Fusarium oxysporum]
MTTPAEVDDFGLPIRRFPTPKNDEPTETPKDEKPAASPVADALSGEQPRASETKNDKSSDQTTPPAVEPVKDDDKSETFEDARSEQSNPSKDASNPPVVTHETPHQLLSKLQQRSSLPSPKVTTIQSQKILERHGQKRQRLPKSLQMSMSLSRSKRLPSQTIRRTRAQWKHNQRQQILSKSLQVMK